MKRALGILAGPLAAALALLSNAPASAQVAIVEGGANYSLNVISMRDIPFRTIVRQQYDYSCGSAALATLLSYHYGLRVNEGQIFKSMYERGDQAKIREVGFSLLDMKRYLESHGLAADGYRATFDQLAAAKAPALLVVRTGTYRHFVVLKGVRDDKVLIGDPALGLKIYDREEFMQMWNGIAFAIHDSATRDPSYNREEEWRPWAIAPLGMPLNDRSLSSFTRGLPPIYQITDITSLDPIFR
ncbi:MAG: C39 family peptidase [Pseudomonadota bacterium]|uniref:C39 family peptidase n=1 Tax=Phenylobacterium sp. TaxID=1871053 RepID=UPI002723C22A|nr:C39 family peptidase [Phenylobacterium sp.]MDO9430030.1 C39 family peptidase [Phenylobacterium sp.]